MAMLVSSVAEKAAGAARGKWPGGLIQVSALKARSATQSILVSFCESNLKLKHMYRKVWN
jgi:hypothetical protein